MCQKRTVSPIEDVTLKKKMFCDNFLTYLFLVYVVCEWKGWYVSLYSVLVIEIIRIK